MERSNEIKYTNAEFQERELAESEVQLSKIRFKKCESYLHLGGSILKNEHIYIFFFKNIKYVAPLKHHSSPENPFPKEKGLPKFVGNAELFLGC